MGDDPITDLALRFQRGDAAAFGELVDQLQERLYRVAYRVVGEPDRALDAVQDAFVKIHTHIGSWDGRARFTSWAFRIVTNAAIDGIRRSGREARAREARAAEETPYATDQVDDGLAAEEQRTLVAQVKAAIEELPAGQRAAVVLRHYEGLSLQEIADARGCALGTVKSTLHQAFRNLRKSLGHEVLQQVGEERS